MTGSIHYKQLLVIAAEQFECIFSEIARMSFLSMQNHHGILQFAGIFKNLKFISGSMDVTFHPSVEFPERG